MKFTIRAINTAKMDSTRNEFQVLRSIIVFYAVNMMDAFRTQKKSANLLFHNKPMFGNVSIFYSVRMIVRFYINIAVMFVSEFSIVNRYPAHKSSHAGFGAIRSGFVSCYYGPTFSHIKNLSALFAAFFNLSFTGLKKTSARTILVNLEFYGRRFTVFA